MPYFTASFRFDSRGDRPGRFQVVCKAKDISVAQLRITQKIKLFFMEKPDFHPMRIYLLEVIETGSLNQPVIMQLTREAAPGSGSEAGSVFFSAAPEGTRVAEVWTEAPAEDNEPFLVING